MHGWTESIKSESIQHIVDAYLTRGGWNIIILNWELLAGSPIYHAAVKNVKKVV